MEDESAKKSERMRLNSKEEAFLLSCMRDKDVFGRERTEGISTAWTLVMNAFTAGIKDVNPERKYISDKYRSYQQRGKALLDEWKKNDDNLSKATGSGEKKDTARVSRRFCLFFPQTFRIYEHFVSSCLRSTRLC